MRRGLFLSLILTISIALQAQMLDPIHWDIRLKPINNTEYKVVFHAAIDEGWHLYNIDLPEGGPVSTSFEYEVKQGLALNGKTVGTSKPVVKKDAQFDNMVLSWFVREATFIQNIKVTDPKTFHLKGHVQFMACNDESCLPPSPYDFEFQSGDLAKKAESAAKPTEKPKTDTIKAVAALSTDTLQPTTELTGNPLWKPVISELKIQF